MKPISLKYPDLLDFLLAIAPVRPVFIKGPPGGGKTSIVELFCKEVGMDCVILHGSSCLPEDVIGLPIPNHETKRTTYYPPERLARETPYCLFLDEFPNASKQVQKAFYSLVQDQRTDSFEMPEGSIVILGGNRQEDLALVNPVSSALINRVVVVEIKDDAKAFLEYAKNESFHKTVIEYIAMRGDHLRGRPGNSGESFSSQRSWHMVSDGLKSMGDGVSTELIQALLYGSLSPDHATHFLAFLKLRLMNNNIHDLIKGKINWPSEPAQRDILVFLADALRVHLIQELPEDGNKLKDSHQKLSHTAKRLIKELSQISMEIAQKVVDVADNGERLPAWFLGEVIRELPRLIQAEKK